MTEFNLSEKETIDGEFNEVFHARDVKEFIKRLKQNIIVIEGLNFKAIEKEVDKLAGEKLIWEQRNVNNVKTSGHRG